MKRITTDNNSQGRGGCPLVLLSRFLGPEQPPHGLRRGVKSCGTNTLDLYETGVLEEIALIPDRDRAAYSLRPGFPAAQKMAGQLALPDYIGELQPPARLQDPEEFTEQGWLIGCEIDYPVGGCHGKGAIREGQVITLDLADRNLGMPGPAEIFLGHGNHLRGEVDPVNLATAANQAGGYQEIETGAATQVEKPLTRSNLSQGKGIPDPTEGIEQLYRGDSDGCCIVTQGLGPGAAGGVGKLAGGGLGYCGIPPPDGDLDFGKVSGGKCSRPGNSGRFGWRSAGPARAVMVVQVHFLLLGGAGELCRQHSRFPTNSESANLRQPFGGLGNGLGRVLVIGQRPGVVLLVAGQVQQAVTGEVEEDGLGLV